MKKMLLLYGLCGMLVFPLCGCGREKVDYAQEEAVQTDSDAETTSEEGYVYTEGIAETLGAEEKIKEQIETGDGKRLNIYGDVIVPDVKSMNVYSAEKCEIDTTFKKQMVDIFSDDGVIYSGDEDKLPKHGLRYNVLYYERERKSLEDAYKQGYWEDDEDAYREYLSECEEKQTYYYNLYEQAGETYQPTDYSAWENNERVVIYHDGVPYYMEAYDNSINCYAVDYADVLTDLPEDTGVVSGYQKSANRRSMEDEDEREKLEKAALDFSGMLGMGTFTVDSFEDIRYANYTIYRAEGEVEDKECGYYVHLCRNLDGVKVDASSYLKVPVYEYPEDFYADEEDGGKETMMLEYTPLESINVILDDDFQVIAFRYESPLRMLEVKSTQVSLLPYETFKNNLLNSLAEQPVEDGSAATGDVDGKLAYEIEKNYSDLELLYFRMENPDKEGEYLLVPAWRLAVSDSDDWSDNACLMNAIDGSRIDIKYEVFEWGEINTEE